MLPDPQLPDETATAPQGPLARLLPHAPELHGFRGALEQALGVSLRARHGSPKELSRAIVRKLRERGLEETPAVPDGFAFAHASPAPARKGTHRPRAARDRAAALRERLISKLSASGQFAGREEQLAQRLIPGPVGPAATAPAASGITRDGIRRIPRGHQPFSEARPRSTEPVLQAPVRGAGEGGRGRADDEREDDERDDDDDDDNLSTRGKVKARLRAKKRRAARRSKRAAQAVEHQAAEAAAAAPHGHLPTDAEPGRGRSGKRVMFREPLEQDGVFVHGGRRVPRESGRPTSEANVTARSLHPPPPLPFPAMAAYEDAMLPYTLEDERAAFETVAQGPAKQSLLEDMAQARQRAMAHGGSRARAAAAAAAAAVASRPGLRGGAEGGRPGLRGGAEGGRPGLRGGAEGGPRTGSSNSHGVRSGQASRRHAASLAQEIQLEQTQRRMANEARAATAGRRVPQPSPRAPAYKLEAAAKRREAEMRAQAEARMRARMQTMRSLVIEPPGWSRTAPRTATSSSGLSAATRRGTGAAEPRSAGNHALLAAASSFSVRPRRSCKCGGGGRWK